MFGNRERRKTINEHWNPSVENNLTNAWQRQKTTKRQETVYRALGLEI